MNLSSDDCDASRQSPAKINIDDILEERGLQQSVEDESADTGVYIEWKENSPSHPRNWNGTRRAFDGSLVLFIQTFTTVLSTAGVSLGIAAQNEYELPRVVAVVAFSLTYQMGRVIGTLTFPPFTECFGRKPTYITTSFVYSVACLICGVVPNVAGVIVGRILSGAMSSVGGAVAAGQIQDMFATDGRVWAVFLWTVTAVIGLALGPIYGSYLAEFVGWRWGFYIAAIVMFGVGVLSLLLRESRTSCVLQQHAKMIGKETGRKDILCKGVAQVVTFRQFVRQYLVLPVVLLTTEPIVATVAILSGIGWSLLFLFTESLSVVFQLYGFTETQTSLFFIPILIGTLGGIPIRLHDYNLLRSKSRKAETLVPEDKLLGFNIGAPALAIGLWWFAWTTPQAVHTHWIVASLALVLAGFAINEFEYVLAGYLTDCYSRYASSAVAAMSLVRSILAGVLPLFAYYMFTGISTNAASSILAAMATVFCSAPIMFGRYGATLRERSDFARTNVKPME